MLLYTVVVHVPVMCPSHFCRVRVTSPSSHSHLKFLSRVRVMTWSSWVTKTVESLPNHWFASSSQCRVTWNFTFFLLHFLCYDMAPNML